MGKNGQRRRDSRAQTTTPSTHSATNTQFAHAARRPSDECGSTKIEWSALGRAVAAGWGSADASDGLPDAAST